MFKRLFSAKKKKEPTKPFYDVTLGNNRLSEPCKIAAANFHRSGLLYSQQPNQLSYNDADRDREKWIQECDPPADELWASHINRIHRGGKRKSKRKSSRKKKTSRKRKSTKRKRSTKH